MSTLNGKNLLFAVTNRHSPGQGVPPEVIDPPEESDYIGYFQNEDGKQLVYVFDTPTRTAHVWMGERLWEEFKLVTDEGGYCHLESLDGDNVPLRPSEQLWLRACWQASSLIQRKLASRSSGPSFVAG